MVQRLDARWAWAALAAAALLSACATRTPPPPPPERPAPAPVPLSPIHRDLEPYETLWHLRAGLNVAALSCAQRVGPAIITDYNAFLKARQALLTRAYESLSADYRAKGGNWQRTLDSDMTRLYNHFAAPTAQAAFCDAAASQVKRAIAAPPADWEQWAAETLAALDRPFTAPQAAAQGRAARSAAAAPQAIPAGWRIQLGAFSSEAAARAAWADVSARSSQLGGMAPHFEPVPGKPLTRLQVKGVESREQAIQLCAHAAAAGFDCLPVKPA